jgi:hypothetical protein
MDRYCREAFLLRAAKFVERLTGMKTLSMGWFEGIGRATIRWGLAST